MAEFRMPLLGADMEAGTLVEWVKRPGSRLTKGDIIAVVDTEKGAIEIEVFEDGVLERTLVAPGEKVPVGMALAWIRREGEPADVPPRSVPAPVGPSPSSSAHVSPAPSPQREPARVEKAVTVRASPGARSAACELRIDLATVVGTGPGGTVTKEDVEAASGQRGVQAKQGPPARGGVAPAPAAPTGDKAAAMRVAIGAAMARSKREIPHVYLGTTVDMTAALARLSVENAARGVEQRLLPVVFLMKAVAGAALEVPGLNGFWRDGGFTSGAGVHIGLAIALRDGGLVAPAIHDADRKSLDEVMADVMDLVARARRGSLRSSELADPTLTLTNLGDLGVEETYAVIYPPQVAIVGFGRMSTRPGIVDGRVEPRMLMRATVSADHRAVDGRRAAQFLAAIEARLLAPERL